MPNWAYCRLVVDGEVSLVEDFMSKFVYFRDDGTEVEAEAKYSTLVPLVGEVVDRTGVPTGEVLDGSDPDAWDYGLAKKLWGTKWEPWDVNVECWNTVCFQSPWGGPDAYVEKVSELYPDLLYTLTVAEGGCDFSYRLQAYGGCVKIDDGDFTKFCGEFGFEVCEDCGEIEGYSCSCGDEEEVAVS